MRAVKALENYLKRTNKLYWLLMFLISAYSLLLLKTVPADSGRGYFATQLMAILAGYLGAILFSSIDYHDLSSYWYVIAGFCLFLILYTRLFGMAIVNSGGVNSRAWIRLPGGMTFQPSELVKIGFILTFSTHLSALKKRELLKSPLHLMLLLIHGLLPVVLVHILQGDDGDAIIFFCMFLFMAFCAGIQLRYFWGLVAVLGAGLPLAWKYLLRPYQKQRLMVTYNLESDPLNYGLQQIQGKISIGSGGMWGRGLFHAPRVNNSVVPVQQSDFIFSVAGEQLGFIGCCAIILLLLLYLWRTLSIATHSPDLLGRSICIGFFGMIAAQMIFNLGMCLDFLPVIGVTLPFFSAGGSSAACLYFGFGLVQNVQMHRFIPDAVNIKQKPDRQRR